jgi:hypothetical protein
MARSPPPVSVPMSAGRGEEMRRQVSGASSLGESLLSEEPMDAEKVEEDEEEVWDAEVPAPVVVEKEKEDPFSLRGVDSRKLAEAVSPPLFAFLYWSSDLLVPLDCAQT